MKWIYRVQNKLQIAFMLIVVLMLVFGKSVIEKNNVSELGGSFSSVYEDRLLAESYIYEISDLLYQKKMLLDQCQLNFSAVDLNQRVSMHNQRIDSLIFYYQNTELTNQESELFSSLRGNVTAIRKIEAELIQPVAGIAATSYAKLDAQFQLISENLHQLSMIQIKEAKRLNDDSKRILAGITVLTQFEQGMLIVISLIIIALIISGPTFIRAQPLNSRLN